MEHTGCVPARLSAVTLRAPFWISQKPLSVAKASMAMDPWLKVADRRTSRRPPGMLPG